MFALCQRERKKKGKQNNCDDEPRSIQQKGNILVNDISFTTLNSISSSHHGVYRLYTILDLQPPPYTIRFQCFLAQRSIAHSFHALLRRGNTVTYLNSLSSLAASKKKEKGIDTVRATRPLLVNVDATGKRKVPIELEGKRPSYTNVI